MTTTDIPTVSDSELLDRKYAVIYTPRRQRRRFPENCVRLLTSRDEALSSAEPEQHLYPAVVYGPSRSSEGFRLYYLVEWIDK